MSDIRINKIRTPPNKSKENSEKSFENIYEENKIGDKCKIHLAEIYTMGKKIDKLNKDLEEAIKTEALLKNNIITLESSLQEKSDKYNSEISDIKNQILDLSNKNTILSKNENYQELILYYEKKFEEFQDKNIKNIQMFSQMLNKINIGGNINHNRDDVWRNLIKKYELKFIELEDQLSGLNKNERKIFSRQKFFEKYCSKAEDKIEKISKVSKKFYEQEGKINELKSELDIYINQNKFNSEQQEALNKEIKNLKNENQNIKKFVNKIKPILKVDWEEIKNSNEENFESVIKNSKNEEFNYNSKNIIILTENVNNFLHIIQSTIKDINPDFPDLQHIIHTVDDIKNYIVMLLKKIQVMTINQYHIINTCCDLNDKIMNYSNKNKVSFDFLGVLQDIRNSCSKLLFEFNPK